MDSQLELAARSFLSQEVTISKKENGSFDVSVSKLFLWYGSDFGDSGSDLLKWIMDNLGSEKFRLDEIVAGGFDIIYRDYDWTSNLLGEQRSV